MDFSTIESVFVTTGGEPPCGLRREFRKDQSTIDAPEFLPRGASNDGTGESMIPRAGWEYIESFF
jgi:hypothetical protein